MRAVWAKSFGAPEVLEIGELPDPVAGPGQALIDVAVADTIFLDTLLRRGAPGPWSLQLPFVPGTGVAGRVSAVGAGVDPSWVGSLVVAKPDARLPNTIGTGGTVAETAAGMSPTGGYAERALAPADALVAVPDGLALAEAAALVNDGVTAGQLTEAADVRPGETVLVTPAGGGAGSLLVQLLRAAGARVIAGAGSDLKLENAGKLGAEVTVNYTNSGWEDEVLAATDGRGADVVVDGVGGTVGRSLFTLTARGGRFFPFGAPSGGFTTVDPAEAEERQVSVTGLMELPLTSENQLRLTRQILASAAAGQVRPTIGSVLDLADAARAHAAIEGRSTLGKIVLRVAE